MRLAADRKVLVLMGHSLLVEESVSKILCPRWEGSATIFPAGLRVLRTGPGGMADCSQAPSAEQMIRCSPPLSLAAIVAYQMVM